MSEGMYECDVEGCDWRNPDWRYGFAEAGAWASHVSQCHRPEAVQS